MFDFIPSTNQPVAWGLGETQGGDIFSIFGVDAPVTPALSFLDGHSQPFLQAQEREERTSMRGENWQSPESLYGPPSEIPDGQPYDSVWVSLSLSIVESTKHSLISINLAHPMLMSIYLYQQLTDHSYRIPHQCPGYHNRR